jgi:hypothetical protein
LSTGTKEVLTVTFASMKLVRLKEAKELFEKDTGNKIEMDDFVDMLVKTYIAYRDQRGASESDLLKKLTQK